MDQNNSNKIPEEKDLSNSFPRGLKNILTTKGGHEKWVLIFLIVIVVAVIPFSIWQINKQLESPFNVKKVSSSSENNNTTTSTDGQLPVIENLRELDTDADGLSDYDELYLYKTSPYIPDSDSDKISDKLEVDQGTNPNCPEGKTCSREDVTTLVEINEELADLEDMSVEQLRQIMIDAGAPAEEVNKISDDELLNTYIEILTEEQDSSGSSGNTLNLNLEEENSNQGYSSLETINYETLFNLNSEEIRQLLIEGGVPKETLDQVDDELLQEIYIESLGQNFEELSQQ